MVAEETVDLETAREMLHQTIREVYDEHWDLGHGWSGDMPTSR